MSRSPAPAAPTPLPLLVEYAQWIVAGTVGAVVWEAAGAPGAPPEPAAGSVFYPDQVVQLRVSGTLKDTRARWRRLVERGAVLVWKPYNARRLAPGDRGIFFLTRNAIPPQGGVPYALRARQTGYIEVGLSQPYRAGGLIPRWVSNGLHDPLPLVALPQVRVALAAWRDQETKAPTRVMES